MGIKDFVYSELKKAMAEAGHVVSEGEVFLAKDFAALKDYAHFAWGYTEQQVNYGLAYPEHLLSELFPGHPDGKAMPAPDVVPATESTTVDATEGATNTVGATDSGVAENANTTATAEQIKAAQESVPEPAELPLDAAPDSKPAVNEPQAPIVPDAEQTTQQKSMETVIQNDQSQAPPPVSDTKEEVKEAVEVTDASKPEDTNTANEQTAQNNPVTDQTKVPTTETPVTETPTATTPAPVEEAKESEPEVKDVAAEVKAPAADQTQETK